MRSLLFVPGDSERKLDKGLGCGADVLLIDLEDSVAPANKPAARNTAAAFISANRSAGAPGLFVRVNAFDTHMTGDDLDAVMAARPDGIMLPKCSGADDVRRLAAEIDRFEAEHGIAAGATRIIPIITETAASVLGAHSYQGALPRLAGVTWGAEDLSADIGALATRDETGCYGDVFRLARAVTVLAASAAGAPAIDTVFVDYSDTEGFAAECRMALRDGFTAKMAIHPAQVPVINAVFTPSDKMVAEAQAIVSAFAEAGNPGVVGIGGKMYDRPHLRRAERILARASAPGKG